MDPQAFVRLSIGSLGIKFPINSSKAVYDSKLSSPSPCLCEFRLRGFPIQTAAVPLISSSQANPDPQSNATIFYLEDSNLKAPMSSGCFQSPQAFLEIVAFIGRRGSHCGISGRRRRIGTLRVSIGPEWAEGKPVVLHNGWISIGKSGAELHLRVKLDPDPRYVFQFDDVTMLSPQIVQLQRAIRQPIFSCKFSQEKRSAQLDNAANIWSIGDEDPESERRERKGWKAVIHDLSGSAVAAAFMATPFVPSSGCDFVQRSNPGAWLIVRPNPVGTAFGIWHPWARLEAWRETGSKDFIWLRLHLLTGGRDAGILVAELSINTEKGGEFFIDMDRPTPAGSPVHSPHSSFGEFDLNGLINGGFVMNCRVQGEGKNSKPSVHLSTRHVSCVEDAALFMALAAAVDLSIEACKPFSRNTKKPVLKSSASLQGWSNASNSSLN